MTCDKCEELFGQLTEYNPEMESLIVYNAVLRELKNHVEWVHSLEQAKHNALFPTPTEIDLRGRNFEVV